MSTAERRAREKAQRHREILEAARLEFLERGVGLATVDDVAARAEVSKGTIYLYFESKEEILAHLLLQGLDQLLAELKAAVETDPRLQADRAVSALGTTYLNFCQSNPLYFRLIMAFDRGRFEESISPGLYQRVLRKSMKALAVLAETVQAGKAAGVFVVADPWQAAGSVWAALNGVLVLMAHPLRQRMLRTTVDDMFNTTLELVVRGLGTNHKQDEKEVGA